MKRCILKGRFSFYSDVKLGNRSSAVLLLLLFVSNTRYINVGTSKLDNKVMLIKN